MKMFKKPDKRVKSYTREKKRAKQRKTDKTLSDKLTKEQYQDVRDNVIEQLAQQRVIDITEKIFIVIHQELRNTLRENRISEERTERILLEFLRKFEVEYKKMWGVVEGEGLPESERSN